MGIRARERAWDVATVSAICVLWIVFWYVLDRRLGIALLRGGIEGLLLGALLIGGSRRGYRNAFVVGGQRATDDERAAAVAALRSGHLPVEPRQRDAAVSFARHQLGRTTSPWPVGVMSASAALVSAAFAVAQTPWYWLMAAGWTVFAAAVIAYLLRVRRRARALLMTPFLEPIA